MSARKVFKGGLVQGVNIPGSNFSNFQQAASGYGTLANKLDRLVNFATARTEDVAIERGKEYAAENPISVQQYYDADPEEREKLIGGNKYTSYGKALRAAQINFLATDLAIKAEKDMTQLKTIAIGSNMTIEMYQAGLDGIVKGYTDAMADTDVEAAISVKAKISSSANTYYTSYLDDKIKEYKDNQAIDGIVYGDQKIAQISDEIKKGFNQSLITDTGEDYEPFDIDKHFAIKKEQYLKELKTKNVSKADIKDWSARWDAEIIEEKQNYLFTKYVNTNENLASTANAREIYKQVQIGNFGDDKQLQKVFNSMDQEDKDAFVEKVKTWRNGLIEDKKKDKDAEVEFIAEEKQILKKQYLKLEEENNSEGVEALIKKAYDIDEALGNEFKVLFNTEKDEGKFLDQTVKDNLYFDFLKNKLTEAEVIQKAEDGLISRATALDLVSRITTQNSAIYTKADLELRRILGVPEPEAINSQILKSKKYREYIRASGELIKYYNVNSSNGTLSGTDLLNYAKGLVDKQQTADDNKTEFETRTAEITGSGKAGYNLTSSDWDNYFRNFYSKDFISVQTDFFDYNNKNNLTKLINELKELKMMKNGVRYKPGYQVPGQLEIGSGVPLVGTSEFQRPNGITNEQIDALIEELEGL